MAPDLVRRDFNPSSPDRLSAADVTQISTGEGRLYLAAVIDLRSRTVAGWVMGPAAKSDLVSDRLVRAFTMRRPDGRVIHHSDRGAAYTSLAFSQRVIELENKRRRRGRPPLGAGAKEDESVRIEPELRELAAQQAAEEGVTVS